jgi:catechol 2,3-dioxygenase-like lactoylglutathione lyase family enzyme
MNIQDSYPLIVTDRMAEARDFYVEVLGMEVAFETDWVTFMTRATEAGRAGLCLMAPGLEHQMPEHREPYRGSSLILTFQVADADGALAEFRERGVEPEVGLRNEPWGQRHFMLRDPAGIWVDIVQQVEPDPDFFSSSERAALDAIAGDSA